MPALLDFGQEGKRLGVFALEKLLIGKSMLKITLASDSFAILLYSSYDVYTPTQNIVYHNFQPNPDGHGPMEWLKPRFERLRQASLHRIRTILELPKGIDGFNRANFGIYGLGKRRTLKQLADFVRIDMDAKGDRPDSVRNILLCFLESPGTLGLMLPR